MTLIEQIKQEEAYKVAHDYSVYVKNGIYIPEPIELKNKTNLERYNKFIDLIIKSNPKEYKIYDFDYMNDTDIIEIFSKLIFMLFGFNPVIENDLKYFINNFQIKKSEFDSPMDGGLCVIEYENDIDYKSYIPNINTCSSIICLLHEFAHFVARKHDLNFNNKYYYEEILSILLEKIGIEILENQGIGQGIQEKLENVRLSSIYYHYKIKSSEYAALFKMLKKENINSKEVNEIIKEINLFEKSLNDAYTFGYIYSENLLQVFINDSKNIICKLKSLLDETITLQQLLDYYNINIKNKNTVECAKRKVRKMTK